MKAMILNFAWGFQLITYAGHVPIWRPTLCDSIEWMKKNQQQHQQKKITQEIEQATEVRKALSTM